jgi:hypothetical protein
MKKILLLLLLVLTSAVMPAQSTLTLDQVGLPPDIIGYANAVITSQQTNTAVFTPVRSSLTGQTTIRVTFKRDTRLLTIAGLNFIHSYVHSYGHVYEGISSTGWHIFRKAGFTSAAGIVYDPQTLLIKKDAAGLTTFKVYTETSTYTTWINRQKVTYTADQVAAFANLSKQVLWERDADYYFATDANPATTLTSAFVTVNQLSADTYNATLWVNLQQVNGVSNRLANNDVIWRFYNDCSGQWGQCEQRAVGSGNQAIPQAFAIDQSKEHITIECAIGDPKRVDFRGYFVVKGCTDKVPCGPAQALPRKPVEQ